MREILTRTPILSTAVTVKLTGRMLSLITADLASRNQGQESVESIELPDGARRVMASPSASMPSICWMPSMRTGRAGASIGQQARGTVDRLARARRGFMSCLSASNHPLKSYP